MTGQGYKKVGKKARRGGRRKGRKGGHGEHGGLTLNQRRDPWRRARRQAEADRRRRDDARIERLHADEL